MTALSFLMVSCMILFSCKDLGHDEVLLVA